MRCMALEVIEDIFDELSELADTAQSSPRLAGRINRLINIKLLGDFYANPIKSQKQREKLKVELLCIKKSIANGKQYGDSWASILYADTAMKRSAVASSDSKTSQIQSDVSDKYDSVSINIKSNRGGTII